MVAVLTVVFGIPIHSALGTSLGAMIFTAGSGAISHFRERNVALKEGLMVGIFGAIGAYGGVRIASMIPARDLTYLTACTLYISTVLIIFRVYFSFNGTLFGNSSGKMKFWLVSCGLGLPCGALSGTCGVGAAPFIQVGLLSLFSLSITEVAGTTMLVILPIAFMGGVGYLIAGYLDLKLFIEVITGLMTGTYIGAKFTRKLPPSILKAAFVVMPIFAATMLLLGF